ncbi:signal peptidase II [Nonomuraea sp. NPDC001636]|uniref:signal peptidase II n=1 Tax=Nonomuraea sp. NPDC001636 TaxID=3154391 RepID=UPI00332DA0F4
MIVLAVVVLLVDQASKFWAMSALSGGAEITVIPRLLSLRLLLNPGAAFSLGEGVTWVFALAAAGAVAGILYASRRLRSPAWGVGLGVLLGGATSHLLDRLFRPPAFAQGHVVDFIDYGGLFVGNVADIALTAGCALLFLLSVRGIPLGDAPGEERLPSRSSAAGSNGRRPGGGGPPPDLHHYAEARRLAKETGSATPPWSWRWPAPPDTGPHGDLALSLRARIGDDVGDARRATERFTELGLTAKCRQRALLSPT